MKTAIFDLDDTLVNSSHLRAMRSAGNWTSVISSISSICYYPGVKDMLDNLVKNKIKIGVFSSSPLHYIDAVIAHLKIPVDFRLSTACGKLSKKDYFGNDLLREIGSLGIAISKNETYMIGDRCVDIGFSYPLKSICAKWGSHNNRDLLLAGQDFFACQTPPVDYDIANAPKDIFDIITSHYATKIGKLKWIPLDSSESLRRDWVDDDLMNRTKIFRLIRPSSSYHEKIVYDFKAIKCTTTFKNPRFKFAMNLFAWDLINELISTFSPDDALYLMFVVCSDTTNPRWNYFKKLFIDLEKAYKSAGISMPNFYFNDFIYKATSTPSLHCGSPNKRFPLNLIRSYAIDYSVLEKVPKDAKLIIIDDVLTKGTSFRAYRDYIRIIKDRSFDMKFYAWGLYTSDDYNNCIYKNLI